MNRSRITGDLVSQNNIFVNTANDRVGIGSTIPTNKLDIRGIVESRSAINFHEGLWTGEATKIQLQAGYLHIEGGSNGTIFRRLAGGNCFQITSAGHLAVAVDSSFDIGTNAARVRNIYADTLYGDGANLTNTGSSLSEPSSGTQRLVTTSLTSGTMTSSGTGSELAFDYANNHLEFLDSVKATFGTGGDLEVYHDGSHSYIHDGGTGNLKVRSNNFRVSNADESKLSATFQPAGAVELYHNNVKMLETTAIGLTISGDVKIIDGENLRLGDSNDLIIYHTGSHSFIDHSGAGNLYIRTLGTDEDLTVQAQNDVFIKCANGEDGIRVVGDGEVKLYHNAAEKLATTASGINVTGKINVDNQIVLNSEDSTPARIDLYCEVSNAHYTRLQAPAHSTYSGNVTVTIPNTSGNLAVLANAANNRIVTATGTHAMTGEANLTFDGSTLAIAAGSSDNKIQIDGTSPYIQFREGTTNKAYIQWSQSGMLQLGNEEAGEVLRIQDGETGLIFRVGSNNRTVWTSGNDGSGSGLDADTVDGIQGGSFLRGDVDDTTVGHLTFNRSVDAKFSLQGSNNPFFNLKEGTTEKARFQWSESGYVWIQNHEDNSVIVLRDNLGFSPDAGSTIHSIFHAGNDGSGSGLDADTLDGAQGSQFLRSDSADTCTGQITFTNSIISSKDGNRSTQGGASLVLTHATTSALRANHFIHDDFPSGSGTYYIQVTESGVSNDRNMCLQGYGGKLGVGMISEPTATLHVTGTFRTTSTSTFGGNATFSNRVRTDIDSTVDGFMGEAYNTYFGLKHTDQTLNSEYMIISKDFDTFISATSGYKVRLRAGGNDSTNELQIGTGINGLTWRTSKVWHQGNDGSGTGLDADTLDGVQGASFLRSDADDTMSEKLTFTQHGQTEFLKTPGNVTMHSVGSGDKQLVLRNLGQLRFQDGADWNYNEWAGIKFITSSDTMFIGGPASSEFTNNGGAANIDINFVGVNNNGLKKDGNTVWHAGNDGSGSGLDADTVDGVHASSFCRTDTTFTFNASGNDINLDYDNNRNIVRIQRNGSERFMLGAAGNEIKISMSNGGYLRFQTDVVPQANNTYDLGSTSNRWRNVYTQDLQLSNEAKRDEGGNDVDGTWGDWTLQEGESDVYMINNRSGKKFRIKMEEVS